jgi:phosphopantothenoylcysteine synthetase/decarboxylase
MGTRFEVAYLIVTGARTATHAPDLVRGLLGLVPNVLTLATPDTSRIIALRDLSVIEGNRVVESYFDTAILPRPPLGAVLVAPCTFNSLNKLAAGIADNLALSVTAEAIGRGAPVVVAVSTNEPLMRHPRSTQSIASLRTWGVTVIEPQPDGFGGLTMASDAHVLAEVSALVRG